MFNQLMNSARVGVDYTRDASGNITGLAVGVGGIALNRGASSCMWLGDSLTQYGKQMHPFVPSRTPFYDLTASPATYAIFVNVPFGVPTGNGTLQYTKATRTMTWAANGVSAGPAVDVSTGGFFTLTDASGNKCYVGLKAGSEPGGDSTITVNVTGTAATKTARLDSFTGWADALLGFPFGEASYNYGLAGTRAQDVWAYRAQWQNVATDLTVIHLGTNDVGSMSDVTTCLTNLQNIIQARMAVGSRPIVGLLFPEEFNSTAVRQAKVVFNMRLRKLCDSLGVDCFDADKYLADPSATTVFAVDTTCYRSDKLHLNGTGGYKVAQYALVPVMSKYVRQRAIELYPGVTYDATLAPDGNLQTNGVLTGTGGTASTGVTGTVASNWTAERGSGSNIAAVGAAPDGLGPSRTDGVTGKYQRFTISGATVDTEYIRFRGSAFVSGSNYAAGDVLVISGDIKISSAVGLSRIMAGISMSNGAAYALDCSGTAAASIGGLNSDTVSMRFESAPITLQASVTNVNWFIEIGTLASGSVVVDIGQQMLLRKLN